ncbi:MAG: sulfatase [bacterium]
MTKRGIAVAAVLVLAILGLAVILLYSTRVEMPNIVIILVDALRVDHLGCYGYNRDTSPNLDRFARDAIRFEGTVSTCSWTSPSIASLFTSLYVSSHGLMTHSQQRTDILAPDFETLAEVLKKRGYTTAAFVANRWIRKEFNYHQGFDLFKQVGTDMARPGAAAVRESVMEWFEPNPPPPFFLYIHFMDVHGPYIPPYPFNTMFTSKPGRKLTADEYGRLRYLRFEGQWDLNFYINQYDGEIRYCDYHIGKILDHLQESGLYDDSIIIITADHGEAFFEHGACDHGFTLYNEETMVPLLMRFPSSMACTADMSIPPQLVDIGATILSLINARFPYEVDGLCLVASPRRGNDQRTRQRIFSEEHMKGIPKVAMIEGHMKYIYHLPEERIVEAYDLQGDEGECTNLVMADRPDGVLNRKGDEIRAWLSRKSGVRKGIARTQNQAEIDPRTLEQLKSLGYIE